MTLSDWLLLIGSLSGWATVFGSLVIYLHAGAAKSRQAMKDELLAKINEQTETMKEDHEFVRLQVADLAKTLSQYYVRRDDFSQAVQGFHTALIEVRKDMGDIRNQLFDIIRSNHTPS